MNYYNAFGNYGYNTIPNSAQPFGYPYNSYVNYGQSQSNSQHQQAQPITNTNKIFVSGLDEVKGKNLYPNSDMMFLDNDKPILYQKVVDGKGQATYKMFDITPHDDTQDAKNENSINLSNYVTLTEFEALKGQINELKNKITKMSVQSELNALTSTAKPKEKVEVKNEQSSKQ